jgi:ribosome-binding protein aMBF1 (putative translation factor)
MGTYISLGYMMEDCNFCGDQTLFIDQKIDMEKVEVKKPSMTICRDCFVKLQDRHNLSGTE